VPKLYLENPTPVDLQRHYIWQISDNVYADSTGFRNCIVNRDGFGHLVNTCHPGAIGTNYRLANSKYVCGNDGSIEVVAARNICAGEEILVDYHDMLALLSSSGEPTHAVALGKSCFCLLCTNARRRQKNYNNKLTKKRKRLNSDDIWPDASSEVYQYITAKYIEGLQPPASLSLVLRGVNPPDRRFNIIHSPTMSFTGAAVTERSWRALLDTLEPVCRGLKCRWEVVVSCKLAILVVLLMLPSGGAYS
jgi:hypothetical protein